MGKEKHEKMPTPGRRLSEEEAGKIMEKFGLKYSEEDKKAGRDLEYFVIATKDRGKESEEERKEISHYIHKWEKVPDEELGWISIEEVIEAIQKYYPEIDLEEKCPVREAVRRSRKEKKHE